MMLSASQPGYDLRTVVVWMGVVITATLVLAVVIVLLRRWMSRGDQPSGTVWTLDELTALRDSGELTIEQYERLRSELFE